ncbi:hypothetical protein DFH09DRAFT_1356924 [Mycena vulgaris]|nr:hypothetical protein DFH09DRAFT_1356924 [Mycena vulgaris]
MIHNLFTTARIISLSLQAHLNLLVLIAAAWNVNSAHAAGEPLPAAALCLILTSLAFFILALLGPIVSCLKVPLPLIGSLKFECGWTITLLVFQLGATIGATVDLPPSGSASAISTSHSFLVPVAWTTTVVGTYSLPKHYFQANNVHPALIYAAVLIGVVMAHKPMYPEIWSAAAGSVDWFVHRKLNADNLENDSWTRYLGDIESSAARKQRFNSSQQFGMPAPASEKAPTEADAAKLNAALPPLPLRVEAKSRSAGSRFIERFRESQVIRGKGATPFPQRVDDHDKPIPLPRWSTWVRADSVHWRALMTRPDIHESRMESTNNM